MQKEEGIAAITGLVAECLALKPEAITPQSRLINDLGASSLDFLDLMFMLERRFGVRVQEDEFGFVSKMDATAPDGMRQVTLSPEALERLKQWLPALSSLPKPAEVTTGQLFAMVTVETLWFLVESKLGKSE